MAAHKISVYVDEKLHKRLQSFILTCTVQELHRAVLWMY